MSGGRWLEYSGWPIRVAAVGDGPLLQRGVMDLDKF